MLLTYLGRRLALALVALFGVVLTAFLVAHSVPADPLATVLSEQATKDPSIRAAYIKRWGLDRTLPEQFVAYQPRGRASSSTGGPPPSQGSRSCRWSSGSTSLATACRTR
jgi:ABC-type dipeptide/oligopeptide/nickel transport system permease component